MSCAKRLAKLQRRADTSVRRLSALLSEPKILGDKRLYHKVRLIRATLDAAIENSRNGTS